MFLHTFDNLDMQIQMYLRVGAYVDVSVYVCLSVSVCVYVWVSVSVAHVACCLIWMLALGRFGNHKDGISDELSACANLV